MKLLDRAHRELKRRMGLQLAMVILPGCTQQEIAPFGKVLFALMVVLLVLIPVVFYATWRRRLRG